MGGSSAESSKSRRTCKCCVPSEGLRRGAWSAQEDRILTSYINTHGEGKWRQLPQKAGLRRCGRSCRLRWLNYLRQDIKRGNISEDEEDLIIRLHKLLGNRWSLIAGRLPGRTDNEIKNYWNTHLIKKLQGKTAKKKATRSKTKKVNKGISSMEVSTVKLENNPHSDRAEATGCNNASSPRPEGNQMNSNINLELVWDGENSIPIIDEPSDFLNELYVSDFLNSEFLQVHGDHEIQVANDAATGSGDGVKNINSSCSPCCSGGSFLTDKLIEEDSTNAAKLENGTSKLNVQLSSTWELNSLYSFLGLEDEI